MILIGRIKGVDLSREHDLHHALWYGVGRGWGILGFLLDVLKGVVPVLAGFLLGFPLGINALAGLAALCGQMWPVFRKFDGERGNTVSLGINFTLSPQRPISFCRPGLCSGRLFYPHGPALEEQRQQPR
jgi:hypothetical protein